MPPVSMTVLLVVTKFIRGDCESLRTPCTLTPSSLMAERDEYRYLPLMTMLPFPRGASEGHIWPHYAFLCLYEFIANDVATLNFSQIADLIEFNSYLREYTVGRCQRPRWPRSITLELNQNVYPTSYQRSQCRRTELNILSGSSIVFDRVRHPLDRFHPLVNVSNEFQGAHPMIRFRSGCAGFVSQSRFRVYGRTNSEVSEPFAKSRRPLPQTSSVLSGGYDGNSRRITQVHFLSILIEK